MKAFVVCTLLLGLAAADVNHPHWATYKSAHNKEYHPTEENVRAKHFAVSHDLIEEHNAAYARGEVSYFLGHNHLSDMSHEEVKSKLLGKKQMSLAGRNFTDVPPMSMPSLPAKVDWRDTGFVTPAKNQESCGSCYSFGVMGVVESAIARKAGGSKMDLSEQQVVDCSYKFQGSMNGGCGGGHEVTVMDYISKLGVVSEPDYSYTSGRSQQHGSCKRNSGGAFGKGLKYTRIASGSEDRVAEALVSMGPLVVSISGENRDFQLFRGGIYENKSCPKQVDHVISMVGFGSEGGKKFWIVKNSWGSTWGENGFGKVLMGVNQCGIVSDHSWHIYF